MRYGALKVLMVMSIVVMHTYICIKNKRENAHKELSGEKTVWEGKFAYSLKVLSNSIYNDKAYIGKITDTSTIINRYVGREIVAINKCAYNFKTNKAYNLLCVISKYDNDNYWIEINKRFLQVIKTKIVV